jgi:hypothetical protein
MKHSVWHQSSHRKSLFLQTAALVGVMAAAVVAKMAAPDIKRYVRLKSM